MIKFENVKKRFKQRLLYSHFDFEMPDKGVIAIIGPSGSGKTTFLNMISGLDSEYYGQFYFNGKNLKFFSKEEMSEFRIKNTGYVFQNFNLFNTETVLQNVLLPLDSISIDSKRIKKKRALDILKLLGIENLAKKRVNKLSGGEKQRVAIGRAIANEPKVVLCDEPTGALDEANSKAIFSLLNVIAHNTLVVIATHDYDGVKNIADYILKIEDEKIKVLKNKTEIIRNAPTFMTCNKKVNKSSLPSSFKFHHALEKNKAKKWRSLIINLMLSLSLTGAGLSIIIKDSVSKKVNEAFSDIINGNQIVMNVKNNPQNTFNSSYSASKASIEGIYEKYNEDIESIGVNYFVNFEDFFKDQNEIYILGNNKFFPLISFSSRSINDFKVLENNLSDVFYPYSPENISNDEVVLGLSYNDMVNICFSLQIQRSYTSLGHFLYENELNIVLKVRNDSWQYDDEQIFKVVAIKESNKSLLYHSNHLWNEEVFETMMRLPSDDDDIHEMPWEIKKLYYLNTKDDPSVFLDKVQYDKDLSDCVFERTNYQYNPLICPFDDVCIEKRVYVFVADKNHVDLSMINYVNQLYPNIHNYYATSQFGYSSFGGSILSGFSKNIFVSLKENLINDAIDADTSLQEDNYQLSLPSHVIQGNYLNTLDGGLRFSTLKKEIIKGRDAKNLNEIVISRGLANSLSDTDDILGKYLYFAGEVSEALDINEKIIKEYRTTKILVVGIVDEDKNYLYHNNDWTISFFRDKLGVSSFLLIPNGIVFEFEQTVNTDAIVDDLNKAYKNYVFTSPLKTLNENLKSTLDYANTILVAFSVLSIVISSLLLCTVVLLSIIESKDEIKLFNYLGIRQKDINSTFVYQGVIQGLTAFFFSTFELFLLDQLISIFLADYLNIGFSFSVNLKPVIFIFLIAIILPFFVTKIMTFFLQKTPKKRKKM